MCGPIHSHSLSEHSGERISVRKPKPRETIDHLLRRRWLILRPRRDQHGNDNPLTALAMEIAQIEAVIFNLNARLTSILLRSALELDDQDQVVCENHRINSFASSRN